MLRPTRYAGFLERRRGRSDGGRASTYTFELAALHIELLVAMAAVDEQVRHIEVETVLGFIDRASLPSEELAKLQQRAAEAVASPPQLEPLLKAIESFATKPSLARALVTDLARVAAADARADPREVTLLAMICDALGIDHVSIDVPTEPGSGCGSGRRDAQPRPPRLEASHRVRTQVRDALERSYADRDRRAS